MIVELTICAALSGAAGYHLARRLAATELVRVVAELLDERGTSEMLRAKHFAMHEVLRERLPLVECAAIDDAVDNDDRVRRTAKLVKEQARQLAEVMERSRG